MDKERGGRVGISTPLLQMDLTSGRRGTIKESHKGHWELREKGRGCEQATEGDVCRILRCISGFPKINSFF